MENNFHSSDFGCRGVSVWVLKPNCNDEKNNEIFYATADCTGHGVPGGFMTMLGLSFLDEIVEVKGVKTPSEILNLMRDKIISTLKQHGNFGESKDGIDITICCLDKNKLELHYASANNSLYIIKNAGLATQDIIICNFICANIH